LRKDKEIQTMAPEEEKERHYSIAEGRVGAKG
jgi:hypothetical protein